MARTNRKHLSLSARKKRGGYFEPERRGRRRSLKTPKQLRANERAELRKEHL